MALHGGKRPGAGRPKGVKNIGKDTKEDIQRLARAYTPRALKVLIEVAEKSKSDPARVSAAQALLDRGYGKPGQSAEAETVNAITDLFKAIDGGTKGVPSMLEAPLVIDLDLEP